MKFFITSIFLWFLALSLWAQDIREILPPKVDNTPAEPPNFPKPDTDPNNTDKPNTLNINQANPEALAAKAGQVIDGSNWDDQSVADEYTKYTGQRVLLSSATQGLEMRFYQRGPLTNREAADLLVKVLDMEGYVFVPSGKNEVKLLPKAAGAGSNGPGELEDIIDNERNIPPGDDYISYFMKLSYIKPDEAVRTFTQSLHGLDPGAKIAPVANASAVLITGKATFVRKLLNQKDYIDVPTGNVNTAWVELKYADAEEVAGTLNEIVNATQQSNTTAGITNNAVRRNNNTPPTPGSNVAANNNNSGGGASSAGETIPVQIVANPRLNKIFIMGRPVDIIFVENLAREFDAAPTKSNYLKRKLHFMIASDFLDVASRALEARDGSSFSGGSNSTGSAQNRNTSSNRNTGNNSGNSSGGSNAGGGVSEFNVTDKPEAIVVGKTFIVADNLANSILVQGPPESIRIVSELIDKLDGRPQQVMISSVFGTVSLDNNSETGLNLGFLTPDLAGGFNNTGLLDPGTLDAGGIADLATSLSGGGLNIYGAYRNLSATLTALESNSDFKVLSKPTIYTANNRVGIISSGQRIAVPTNTITTDTGAQNTNIEFRDVLLKLEVVPLINSNEEVTLKISLLNEDVQGSQTIDGEDIPTIVTESIDTTVTVPNGATVILGGLITEDVNNVRAGVPLLSSIPGVGRLFRRDSTVIARDELLIFIRPTIINGPESQRVAQSALESRYEMSDSIHEFDNNGLLPTKPLNKKQAKSSQKANPSVNTQSTSSDETTNVTKKKRIPNLGRGSQFRYPSRR